jgi:hypothetical protein
MVQDQNPKTLNPVSFGAKSFAYVKMSFAGFKMAQNISPKKIIVALIGSVFRVMGFKNIFLFGINGLKIMA